MDSLGGREGNSKAAGHSQGQSSFFGVLNLDVRIIIYDYVGIPLRSSGSDYAGFILSCQLAKRESEDSGRRRIKAYLKDFKAMVKEALDCDIVVPDFSPDANLAQLRQVDVVLPYPFSEQMKVLPRRALWRTMYPLFTKPFKSVNISFRKHTIATSDHLDGFAELLCSDLIESRYYATIVGYPSLDLVSGYKPILEGDWRTIGLVYNSENSKFEKRVSQATRSPQLSEELDQAVKAKRIVFSWDFRSAKQQEIPAILNGEHYLVSTETGNHHKRNIDDYPGSMYRVNDVKGLVGEAGFMMKTESKLNERTPGCGEQTAITQTHWFQRHLRLFNPGMFPDDGENHMAQYACHKLSNTDLLAYGFEGIYREVEGVLEHNYYRLDVGSRMKFDRNKEIVEEHRKSWEMIKGLCDCGLYRLLREA